MLDRMPVQCPDPARSPPAGERPVNLVVLLREAYVALDNLVPARLVERGHDAIRPAHSAVFEYLDETGTTVSQLAERARMTKQAMAELVEHLEAHGYVVRRPNPADGRSKLVVPTERGMEVVAIAQAMVPEVEQLAERAVGRRPTGPPPAGPGGHPAGGRGQRRSRAASSSSSSVVTSGSACRCTSCQSEPSRR